MNLLHRFSPKASHLLLTVVSVLLVAQTARAQQPDSASQPNLLVFIADDAGWDDFGAYGNEGVQTPNIDRLAAEGLKVERAFLTIAQCSPSRISILSGLYPHQTGAEDLHMPLPEGKRLAPSYLGEAGYASGHMRKTHYGERGEAQFDWYDGVEERDYGRAMGDFLDETGGRPFFLWVGFSDPHRAYGDAPEVHDPADVRVPPYLVDTPETRSDLARYYDEIARMDQSIGAMLDTLEARGLRGNTLVTFISDNGMPFPRAKGTAYDAGIRTPLILSWPDVIEGGTVYDGGLVSVIDLAPTWLDLAGLDVPDVMEGESLRPLLLTPESYGGREYVFAERNWHNCDEHIRAVRTARYKLITNAYTELPLCTPADASRSPSWYSLKRAQAAGELTSAQQRLFEAPRARVEFYDLQNDPGEFENVAADAAYADAVQDLASALNAWMEETSDFPPTVRRRDDNTDRVTGIKFTQENPPMYEVEEGG